jgi:hypothetical protein
MHCSKYMKKNRLGKHNLNSSDSGSQLTSQNLFKLGIDYLKDHVIRFITLNRYTVNRFCNKNSFTVFFDHTLLFLQEINNTVT